MSEESINYFEEFLNKLSAWRRGLKPQENDENSLIVFMMYDSICELASNCGFLLKHNKVMCVPIILRSIIERCVDLLNAVDDPKYIHSMYFTFFEKKLEFLELARGYGFVLKKLGWSKNTSQKNLIYLEKKQNVLNYFVKDCAEERSHEGTVTYDQLGCFAAIFEEHLNADTLEKLPVEAKECFLKILAKTGHVVSVEKELMGYRQDMDFLNKVLTEFNNKKNEHKDHGGETLKRVITRFRKADKVSDYLSYYDMMCDPVHGSMLALRNHLSRAAVDSGESEDSIETTYINNEIPMYITLLCKYLAEVTEVFHCFAKSPFIKEAKQMQEEFLQSHVVKDSV